MNRLLIGSADKTNLLLQLLQNETTVTVIDPTGELARAAANRLPPALTQRALYFDPADMARPVGLNVLEKVSTDDRHRVTEQLCAYFEAMWPNGWGAQSNYILANCLRLLLDSNETLLGTIKLLTDPTFSEQLLRRCRDPIVRANWNVINSWDQRQRQAALAPLQNKLGTLLMSPMIRNIVGQTRTTFSNKTTVIIANLDRAKLGDITARLLGGLLITRSTGHVIINDYGFFSAPLPLPERRFTIAVNFLDELSLRLRNDVLGIEQKFVFKTHKKDADELSFHVRLMNPRVLVDLDPGEVRTAAGFLYPERPPSLNRLKALKRRTKACHTRTRLKVERDIQKFMG
ncbi:hypothetical protein [Bradyrhizobium cytisi]|uniref:Uncharacterized protein n=1 Tax=Bradyrhizobium cytisi TaxID=515489 RepID=A0A5S4WY41_9BRAD|nr:hypothetical protein [Bradyrhizobium cytisi]TYL86308.1 hypothetical protein FXB38_07450 [Bradyrhizobium cytisi]